STPAPSASTPIGLTLASTSLRASKSRATASTCPDARMVRICSAEAGLGHDSQRRDAGSAVERPFAVDLAAGDTLDLLRIVPEGDGIVHVAADPALFVAEGGGWLDLADQSPLRPAPHQSGPVAQLVQRQSQRLDRQRPVTFVEPGAKLGQRRLRRWRNAAFGPGELHLLFGVRRRRGGRNQAKKKNTRPHDERGVPK